MRAWTTQQWLSPSLTHSINNKCFLHCNNHHFRIKFKMFNYMPLAGNIIYQFDCRMLVRARIKFPHQPHALTHSHIHRTCILRWLSWNDNGVQHLNGWITIIGYLFCLILDVFSPPSSPFTSVVLFFLTIATIEITSNISDWKIQHLFFCHSLLTSNRTLETI